MPFVTIPSENDPDVEPHHEDMGGKRTHGAIFGSEFVLNADAPTVSPFRRSTRGRMEPARTRLPRAVAERKKAGTRR